MALLLFLSVTRSVRVKPVRTEWGTFLALFASVFFINSIRLYIMTQTQALYWTVHGPVGSSVVNLSLMSVTLAWTVWGLRHEIFA